MNGITECIGRTRAPGRRRRQRALTFSALVNVAAGGLYSAADHLISAANGYTHTIPAHLE
jgi:hypothetical protein